MAGAGTAARAETAEAAARVLPLRSGAVGGTHGEEGEGPRPTRPPASRAGRNGPPCRRNPEVPDPVGGDEAARDAGPGAVLTGHGTGSGARTRSRRARGEDGTTRSTATGAPSSPVRLWPGERVWSHRWCADQRASAASTWPSVRGTGEDGPVPRGDVEVPGTVHGAVPPSTREAAPGPARDLTRGLRAGRTGSWPGTPPARSGGPGATVRVEADATGPPLGEPPGTRTRPVRGVFGRAARCSRPTEALCPRHPPRRAPGAEAG